jgi:molybdopterin-guanine dinucleotide biosynthesis protein
MVPVLRIVGAPGSGKTLLIVSLAEALRSRGQRVATVAPRRGGATVIVLSNSGRVTMPPAGAAPMPLARLQTVIPSLDPSVTIILAEDYDAPEDTAFPAVTLGRRDAAPRSDVLATVASEDIEATFARLGPGETNGLVDLVEREVLGIERAPTPAPAAARARSGWMRRLFGMPGRG